MTTVRPWHEPDAAGMADASERALDQAARLFAEHFGGTGPAPRFVYSPYRICPLGAHVDHQDGAVTGMAIDHGVVIAFAPRASPTVRAVSANFPGLVAFDLEDVPPARPGEWGNFVRGAVMALRRRYRMRDGADLALAGELPVGGLSSSAAVAVGCLLALEAANGLEVAPAENVALARAIENEYIGLHSGVLDQSTILLSQRDRLLWLDCRTLAREYVAFATEPAPRAPAPVQPPAIAIAYSGLSQALVTTGYNRRVAECLEAAAQLLALAGLPAPADEAPRLRDVPVEVFERYRHELPPPLARRAAHYFGEQARVAAGIEAWRRGDLARFGGLVTESGRSSIERYECGAPELVTLYEALIATPGVYGARFSGAGFRGSCLALVEPGAFETIAEQVRAVYAAVHPERAPAFGFFRCASSDGARLLGRLDR
jgi:galactokinase